MLCTLCHDIFKAPIDFKTRPYKKSVDQHRDAAASDDCYMCDCIWRSFLDDDKEVEPAHSIDYHTTYRFIDQSDIFNGHIGLIALVIHINHKSGRVGNPTRRYYPAFYVEPVTGQSDIIRQPRKIPS